VKGAARRVGWLLLLACRGPGTHTITCPDGFTQCGTDCVDLQNDALNCGACGYGCASGEQCFNGACMPACATGEHPCSGVCVSSTDPGTCGTRCTPCPVPDGGIATCDGTTCGGLCDPKLRFCGGACASCPATGGVMCSGDQCVPSGCSLGQHLCNGHCVDENPNSCGDGCAACPAAPASGFQTCLDGACSYLCRAGYRVCPSGCCRTDVMEVGAEHSCQITPAGALLCWGRNHLDGGSGGTLGVGDYVDRSQPTQVLMETTGVEAVQGGSYHTCAMDMFGAVKCWGVAGQGRIGDGSMSDKLAPAAVTGLGAGVAIVISAGGSGACAMTHDGKLQCWGDNTRGEVGDGTTMPRPSPTPVPDLGSAVVDVSYGGQHVCALTRGGIVRCWGANDRGQLGDGTQMDRPRPVVVPGLTDAVRISAGDAHTCAIRMSGDVVCWGDNTSGQLGVPKSDDKRLSPSKVNGLSAPIAIAAGGAHTCALMSTGQVLCWGANGSGQLGDGMMLDHETPQPVSMITDGTTISAGRAHSCARTQSGTRCWGDNQFGQLGDGSNMNSAIPVMPH
jgi:alpha-tubulin suppressor-like RCC1 family protein